MSTEVLSGRADGLSSSSRGEGGQRFLVTALLVAFSHTGSFSLAVVSLRLIRCTPPKRDRRPLMFIKLLEDTQQLTLFCLPPPPSSSSPA